MPKIFLGCALLATLVLGQPAAAQAAAPTAPVALDQASHSQVQTAELSEFLVSLSEGTPQKANEIENHCVPSSWCQDLQAQCELDCAPCGVSSAVCYHYICDIFCSCKAC